MVKNILNRLLNRPVVYGDNFFRNDWFKEWATLREVLFALIESDSKWRSVLDFGCGPGVMIDFLNDRNVNCVGCDYSQEARDLYLKKYGKYPSKYIRNLDETDLGTFDLLIAFDVLEHMHDEEVSRLVNEVNAIPELLLNISRARGIPGHINIKSDQDWIFFIQAQGYAFEAERTRTLRNLYARLRPGSPDQWDRNLFLFRRAGNRPSALGPSASASGQ